MDEEEKKREKELKKELAKDKFKYLVIFFIIGLIVGKVKLGLFDFFGVTDDAGPSVENTSLVDLPKKEFPELTPASIKESAFVPEATEPYSYAGLEFKLPNTYFKDPTNKNSELFAYTTGINEHQQYTMSVFSVDVQEGTTLEDNFDTLKNGIYNIEGYTIEQIEDVKTEIIHANNWYVWKVKGTKENQVDYEEVYWIIYNEKLYQVLFGITRDDGTLPDFDDARNFASIKGSFNLK